MGFIKEPDPRVYMLEKIKASGLTEADAKQLGFTPCTIDQVTAKYPAIYPGTGFVLPYYTAQSTKMLTFRYRYANPRVNASGRPMKYSQPAGSPPAVYLPHLKGVNWQAIQANADAPLIITEGELKAACATKMGHPTIGLGGVWNFRSTQLDLEFLPQLEEFVWKGRTVYICYDSDSIYNTQVQKALNMLARMLSAREAVVYIATPPDRKENGESVKVGLDDLVVVGGVPQPALLEEILSTAELWEECSEIYKLNAEVAYISTPSMIAVLPQPHFPKEYHERVELISCDVFRKQRFYDRTYTVLKEDGTTAIKRAAETWFGDPRRRAHHSIVYAPGAASVVDGQFNMWQGWPNEPVEGDVAPWLDLMDQMFSPEQQAERDWFLDWLAYPVQFPGTKLNTAVLLWGLQMTGKSTVGVTMKAIYGAPNCSTPGQGELERDFNSWLMDKQFIVAEEITGNDARKHVSKLKHLITGSTIHINKKGIEPFDYPNKANFLFTSNYSNAIYIDDDDRRYFVHELRNKLLPSWWKRYSKWLYEQNGAAHLHHWLRTRDLSKFSSTAPAMTTQAHKDAVLDSMSDLDAWMYELKNDPDSKLFYKGAPVPFRLWSSEELFNLYLGGDTFKRVTKTTVGRALARAGFSKVNNGNWIELAKGGKRAFVWAIRDKNDSKMMQGEAQKLYRSEREAFEKAPKFKGGSR